MVIDPNNNQPIKYVEKGVYRDPYYYVCDSSYGIVKVNIAVFLLGHFLWFISVKRAAYNDTFWCDDGIFQYTVVWSLFLGSWAGLGITAGCHRMWSHRSYKARTPLKVFLMLGHCIAGENSILVWCRDHRIHHKFSETDADPHNTKRGFFFAHVGWLLKKKHPEFHVKRSTLNFSDLTDDPIVWFQHKYYLYLYLLWAVFLPVFIPCYFWNENITRSFMTAFVGRYMTSLHSTWFVNSTAHMFGHRPYDKAICSRENIYVSFGSFGEGFHNFHHTFPWDYATSEMGYTMNVTKMFIDSMAWMGQAYDLKKATNKMVIQRKIRTGEDDDDYCGGH